MLASDADAEMLALIEKQANADGIILRQGNFTENPFSDFSPFGFVLLDLGISSAHFDHFERGFSFRFDQPLDMRLDTTQGKPAAELLKTLSEEDLSTMFFQYGEERQARRIARMICEQRKIAPIERTGELAEICARAYPPRHKAKGHAQKNPATRVFQALRIAVNGELDNLRHALATLPQALAIGGRLAIITFHSLEDRMVKLSFRERSQVAQNDPAARSNFLPGDYRLIEPGGITPTDEEIAVNSRARSARLRILERVK